MPSGVKREGKEKRLRNNSAVVFLLLFCKKVSPYFFEKSRQKTFWLGEYVNVPVGFPAYA